MARAAPSKRIKIPKGVVVLSEGELNSCAYRVLSGRVEVYKSLRGRRVVLARLGPGQFFGEMGLILDSPRTASVAAMEDSVLRMIDQRAFQRVLRRDPASVLPLLRILFERLRVMNAKYLQVLEARLLETPLPAPAADLSLEQGRGDPGARGALSILPATPEAERAVGRPSVKVGALPFRIGRRDRGLTSSVFSLNDLTLSNDPPYQVSRNHCSIDLNPAGGFLVQDRGSTLGTSVNGVRIGTGARRTEAPLDRETNVLALGNASSPYRFEVVFSPRARSA